MKRYFFLLTLAALSAACSSTSNAPDDADTDTNTNKTEGSGSKKTGSTDTGDDDDDDIEPVKSGKTGTITLGQNKTVAGSQTYYSAYATAFFASTASPTPAASEWTCETSTVGGCSVVECDGGPSDDEPTTKPTKAPSAGVITIGGASTDIELSPTGANGTYETFSTTTLAFEEGDELVVSAKGKDVPAFSGKSVDAPSNITVTAPKFTAQKTTLDRSTSLKVAWSDGGKGDVTVLLSTSRLKGAHTVTVSCKTSASKGSATIPVEALEKLEEAGTTANGSLSIVPSAETTFTAGDYDVTFRVVGSGTAGVFTFE